MNPEAPLNELLSSSPLEWQVPAYREEFYLGKKRRWAVCIFVINEGERIQRQVQSMAPLADLVDLCIADGGSKDGSLEPGFLQDHRINALLVKTGTGKLSAQMRMALSWCMARGYDGVIVIDGNGKDGIAAIPEFVRLLESGLDHVQGSRYVPGGHHENTPAMRHWGVKLLHSPLISLASGFHYSDTTNGFRGYSRRFLLDPRVQPFRDIFQKYELHYYLAIQAARLKFNVVESPVSRVYPAEGKVPTKISPLRGNLLVLETLFKACLGFYHPKTVK
jgi:glycosyltransferase involved in cell wall biosynthesis